MTSIATALPTQHQAAHRAATALLPGLQAHAGLNHLVWSGQHHPNNPATGQFISSGFPQLDQELPGAGWAAGQVTELLYTTAGIGELSLLLPCLATLQAAGKSCVWVLPGHDQPAHNHLPYAPGLQAAGLKLSQHLFVQANSARESIWAMEQSLRSKQVGALIAWMPSSQSADAHFRSMRRLQLLAQAQGTTVFVLRPAQQANLPSPAGLRLSLQAVQGRVQVQILKRRARPLLDPVLLQIHPDSWNTPSSRVAPASSAIGNVQSSKPAATLWDRLRHMVGTPTPLGVSSALPGAC